VISGLVAHLNDLVGARSYSRTPPATFEGRCALRSVLIKRAVGSRDGKWQMRASPQDEFVARKAAGRAYSGASSQDRGPDG